MNKPYQPPITITPIILRLVAEISSQLGQWVATLATPLSPQLRRANRIRTIQASLAIEHNTLSVAQVTDIVAGKRVRGLPREIQEVRNALQTYEQLERWHPTHSADLLTAHRLLMSGLVDHPGQFRTQGVAVYREKKIVHMAPPASRVAVLMKDLLTWLANTEWHPLIASCVFHYEFEFIHPFDDGNGRMGRLWQTLILSRWQPLLAYLPVETVIRDEQAGYYQALASADQAAEATVFVEFMLAALAKALQESSEKSSENSSEKSSEKTEMQILALLRQQPTLTIAEIARALNRTSRTIEKNIQQLKAAGQLHRVGSDRRGRWEVSLK